MSKHRLLAALAAAFLSTPVATLADGIMIRDAYVRAATPSATSAAAFMTLMNHSETADRLIGVASKIAKRVELHSHTEDAGGVMRMVQIEGGIVLPAGGMHVLDRGGDHVMFMGLNAPLEQGGEITLTLTFEQAGEVVVQIPVDHKRKPAARHNDHAHDG